MIELCSGSSRAEIDLETFSCSGLAIADWKVLDSARVEFPWVGFRAARPARLRIGGVAVDVGGGPPGGLTFGGWSLDARQDECVRGRLQTNVGTSAYPFQVDIVATWRLDTEGLWLELDLSNRSKSHAPFGLGMRVDVGPLATKGDELVQILAPAEQYSPRDAALDLRRPTTVMQRIETTLTRRHFANLQTQLAILCPSNRREVWLNTSSDFREAELAIEPDGRALLESATCLPDAFALHAMGVDTGLRVLAPGEAWHGRMLLVAQPATN